MISTDRCKEILKQPKMQDSEVLKLREALYVMVESIVDDYMSVYSDKQHDNSK